MYLFCVLWFFVNLERATACEGEVSLMELCKKMGCYAQICLEDGKEGFQGKFDDFAGVVAL